MKRFTKLRMEMKERGVRGVDIAKALRISEPAVSNKMNGRVPWTLGECYKVLRLLNYDWPMLPILFPEYEVAA